MTGEMNGVVVELKPSVPAEQFPVLLERVTTALAVEFARVRTGQQPNGLVRVEGAWRVVSGVVELLVSCRRVRCLSGQNVLSVVRSLDLCFGNTIPMRVAKLSVNAVGRDDWWAGAAERRWGWVGADVDVQQNRTFAAKVKERLDKVSASAKEKKRAEKEAGAKQRAERKAAAREEERRRQLAQQQGGAHVGVVAGQAGEREEEVDVAEKFGALRPVEEEEREMAEGFLSEMVGMADELAELGKRAQRALRGA